MEEEHLFVPNYNDEQLNTSLENCPPRNVPTKPGRGTKKCPICETYSSNLKKHMLGMHLPYWFDSQLTCLQCKLYIGGMKRLREQHLDVHESEECYFTNLLEFQQKMLYLLKFISLELTGDHDLDALLQVVQHNQWYPKYDRQRITFNAVELATVRTFQSIWKEVNNPVVTPPNCKGSLLHWRIITELISKCSSEVQQKISKLDTCCPENIEPNIQLSDAHFHLDQMYKMFHTQDFKTLEHNITSGTNLPVLHAAITNFVFPSSWDNIHLEDP